MAILMKNCCLQKKFSFHVRQSNESFLLTNNEGSQARIIGICDSYTKTVGLSAPDMPD